VLFLKEFGASGGSTGNVVAIKTHRENLSLRRDVAGVFRKIEQII